MKKETNANEEICAILESRAKSIIENFDLNYTHCESDQERDEKKSDFVRLHEKHVAALKCGDRALAHKIFINILILSRGIEEAVTKKLHLADSHMDGFYLENRFEQEILGAIEQGYLRIPGVPSFNENYFEKLYTRECIYSEDDISNLYELENVRAEPGLMARDVFRKSKYFKACVLPFINPDTIIE